MNQGIGKLLFRLREEAELTQKDVAAGLCSVSELARIEQNELVPGHFELDRIMGRLGKSTEHLEYVLPKAVYELYELRYLIQVEICHRRFDKAKDLLKEYEKKKQGSKPLHRQFVSQEKAQIAWLEGAEKKEVLQYLEEAIVQTIPTVDFRSNVSALSAEELRLLIFRIEVCEETEVEIIEELKRAVLYTESRIKDAEEKAKIYPYVTLLLSKYCDWEREYGYLSHLLENSFALLRRTGYILYLPEIMEVYADLLERRGGDEEKVQTIRRERNTLLWLEDTYDVHLEKYRVFQTLNREFELDYEWLRQTRMAAAIPQEELCDGICAQETLSRIESGKRMPNQKKYLSLLERMGRCRTSIETVITTEDYETIDLKKEYEYQVSKMEKEKAQNLLENLKKKLDLTILDNKKYIYEEEIMQKYEKGELSSMQAIDELHTLVKEGLPLEKSVFDYKLTSKEVNILNRMCVIYYGEKKWKEGIRIHRKVLENYDKERILPEFHAREWRLQLSNLAMFLEETGEIEEAIDLSEKNIENSLKIGKGEQLGRFLTTIASAYEQEKGPNCPENFKRAMDMLHLFQNNVLYKLVKEHMNVLEED